MAAQITHIVAGEEALSRAASPEAGRILREAGSYFRLGCQGPDIFYHNQRTKPSGLHYGALAHRRGYGALVAGAFASLPEARRPAATPTGAYILGLATHAAIDRAAHPFIVYFSGWADPSRPGTERYRACHPFFERLLDLGYLAAARGLRGRDFDIEALLTPEAGARCGAADAAVEAAAAEEELVALWTAGLRSAFPGSAGGDFLIEKRVANALIDGRYFYSITNPAVTALDRSREDWFAYLDDRAGPRSVSLVYPDELPAGADLMNLGRAEWSHPSGDGRRSRESYLELVEMGIGAASLALGPLLEAMAGRRAGTGESASPAFEAIRVAVGDGGLSVCAPDGGHAAPRACAPLPLPEIMEAEYRKRLEWARRLLSDQGLEGREPRH